MRISHEAIYQALFVQGRGASNDNSSHVCARAERSASHEHARRDTARSSSLLR